MPLGSDGDEGGASSNPFVAGVPRDVEPRDYEVWLVPEQHGGVAAPNALTIPAATALPTLFYRVYLADAGLFPAGGVGVPTIEAFDAATGAPVACPRSAVLSLNTAGADDARPDEVAPENLDRENIFAGKPPSDVGLFGNGSNPYMVAPLLRDNDGQLAVLRFRAPSFTATTAGGGQLTGREEVRYWSACLGDIDTTATSECLPDESARVDEDGWVRIAVGPFWYRQTAEQAGFHFFAWGLHGRPMLMFRQLLPAESFAGSFARVEAWTDPYPQIGDYAPLGRYCTMAEFAEDRCGL